MGVGLGNTAYTGLGKSRFCSLLHPNLHWFALK